MRKAASKLRWRGRGVLVALTLAVGVLGLLLLGSSAKADPGPQFNATASTDISDYDCLANADIESTFNMGDDPWPAAQYEPGKGQPSFDKQFVRDWLEATDWDKNSQPPALPEEIVEKTRAKYIEAYEQLTDRPFQWK